MQNDLFLSHIITQHTIKYCFDIFCILYFHLICIICIVLYYFFFFDRFYLFYFLIQTVLSLKNISCLFSYAIFGFFHWSLSFYEQMKFFSKLKKILCLYFTIFFYFDSEFVLCFYLFWFIIETESEKLHIKLKSYDYYRNWCNILLIFIFQNHCCHD